MSRAPQSPPELRRQEADYALERIRELAWIDQSRAALMGFSEGERVVALREAPGLAAHIILMAPAVFADPGSVPVLSVAVARDEYAEPDAYHAVAASGAKGSMAMLIPDQGDDILAHPEFKAALNVFVREHVL